VSFDFKRFAAQNVIIHDVPQRFVHEKGQQIELSGAAEKLTGELLPFFDRKLKGSLGRYGFDVSRDADSSSPLPGLIAEIVLDSDKLVSASQEMAKHLYSVQTGVNPAGLLCVATGKCGDSPALAVLKLERDEGARVQRKGKGKDRTLTMAYLNDLMISGKTRIFKASLFSLSGSTVNSLTGRVADDQRGTDYHQDVASFFLSLFLGCKLRVEPRIATRDAFTATEEFINEVVDRPEKKAAYTLSLQAAMQSPANDFRPRDFAEQFFKSEDRTAYRGFLTQKDIDPDQAIPKDLDLIENRIKRVKMETESGVVVFGTGALVDERVDVKEDEVVIRDRVVRAKGG
jgi:37-kD nucleoid-associated bacterial protein